MAEEEVKDLKTTEAEVVADAPTEAPEKPETYAKSGK